MDSTLHMAVLSPARERLVRFMRGSRSVALKIIMCILVVTSMSLPPVWSGISS